MTRVYVTGGNGFLGRSVVAALAARKAREVELVVSGDIRPPTTTATGTRVVYEAVDVTEPGAVLEQLRAHRIDTVVHLASIVNPGRSTTRAQEYHVDVVGSRAVLDACVAAGVRRLVVSSSGAAYGYHADSPDWLTESDPVRGNDAFPYARHKRIVEEMLGEARREHPELEQVVFRIGTILGETVSNQITALFDARRILAVRGSESPFVFIWDTDVVAAMVQAVTGSRTGTFNVAGDGAIPVSDLARMLGKRVLRLPAWVITAALAVGHAVGATAHGPEQVMFLRYRPVLDNTRLKVEFGYLPRLTSEQAFAAFISARARRDERGQTSAM